MNKKVIALIVLCIAYKLYDPSDSKPDTITKTSEAKNTYMEQSLPQLKKVRDQIVFQIKTCDENVIKLNNLKRTFEQQESREFVHTKIVQIEKQKQTMREHLVKIDAQVEKGMALQLFNSIDGGGLHNEELDKITQEAQKSLNTARKVNSSIAKEYGVEPAPEPAPKPVVVTEPASPPKVIPVIKPKPPVPPEEVTYLKRLLGDLYSSRRVFEEQLNRAQTFNDELRIRINKDQLNTVNKKIAEAEERLYR